ncbi:MAG: hypothetical protein ACRDTD_08830 [Pseudonocardiaceae bacterium]
MRCELRSDIATPLPPRGLVGCVIAAVASGTATPVLAPDRDFTRIADVIDLVFDEHSLRP